jgi:hypothetical protein
VIGGGGVEEVLAAEGVVVILGEVLSIWGGVEDMRRVLVVVVSIVVTGVAIGSPNTSASVNKMASGTGIPVFASVESNHWSAMIDKTAASVSLHVLFNVLFNVLLFEFNHLSAMIDKTVSASLHVLHVI